MRTLVRTLFALGVVAGLSGCVAYGGGPYGSHGSASVYYSDAPYGYGGYGYDYRSYDGRSYPGRRDGDGVPNRYDSRPYNPRRY